MSTKNTFVLEDELDELAFDFRTKANPNGAHGVIAEPSTAQLQRFQRKLRKLMEPALLAMAEAEKMSDADKLSAAFGGKAETEDEMLQAHREGLAIVAELCSNNPSVDDIAALPHRAQQVFIGWIAGVFMDPEAQTLGSTR